ncbi:hypothetical protein P872_10075 [Rhodonellum psychrophilum GCM71 = DSM 17998]|uniref:Uncharacterized protein n=1 Tax=Rhodonellum psychrophilum GCM71 = DSM 17998 TaxID=1123057 RepID=U5BLC3_9BACT|nr:hypothetical protein P872_10075 [Rhodonellum psychrophilum GCM71 = DSM 17998]
MKLKKARISIFHFFICINLCFQKNKDHFDKDYFFSRRYGSLFLESFSIFYTFVALIEKVKQWI